MERPSFIQFRPQENGYLFEQLIDCFILIFGQEPWNEWKLCPSCGKKWGSQQKGTLELINFEHCGQPVIDFWPKQKVREDALHEITDESSCWLALIENRVIGFCWGYPIEIKKLGPKLELDGFIPSFISAFNHGGQIAYVDEIGVEEKYRGKKIGKELFARMKEDFKQAGLKIAVARTKNNPPTVLYHWFKKDGYLIVDKYYDADDRVILANYL